MYMTYTVYHGALKTPYSLLIGLGEMVLINKLTSYRLPFIGALMTVMERYAQGFNSSINAIAATNHYLIGFKTYSTGGNPCTVL